MSCLLLSGFKGTGKDTLYSKLYSDPGTELKSLGYKCYTSPENKKGWSQVVTNITKGGTRRLSFADPLKKDVSQMVIAKRPDLTPAILEANKNKALKDISVEGKTIKYNSITTSCRCNKCFQELSYRDHLIEHAYAQRQSDEDYWCKRAITDNKGYTGNVVVTDYRYPNEKVFMSKLYTVTTAWIYRKAVEIPPPQVLSEWALHSETMDYLITDDFTSAIKLRPQYKDYVEC
jgi:hypothetical protein